MNVSSSILSAIDLQSASALLIQWIGLSLLYGTLLALVTWLMMKLAFRRVGLAFGAVIWSIVLLKFMIPTGPGFSFSLASITQRLSPLAASDAGSGTAGSLTSADAVRFVTIFEQGASSPDSAAALVPLPTTTLSWTVWVALGYFAVVAVLALVRARGYSRIVRRCRSLPEAPAESIDLVRQTCARHGVAGGPHVRVSGEAAAPFVVGLFRPILVLSPRHLNDAGEAEAVVLHEMAHLRPFDVFVRCLQCLVGTLLFFWPVVAWVNRRIDLAREHACDDWALSHGRLTAAEYARCLLRAMQPVRSSWSLYRPAAMAANRRHVERRIEMILDHPRYKSHARKLGVGAFLVVTGWAVFALSGSSAVDAAVAPADPAAPSNGEAKVIMTRVAQAGDGEMEVRVIQLDGGDMKVKVLGAGADADVTLPMEQIKARAMAFVAAEGGPECVMAGSFARVDEETLPQFKIDHPAADLDANGELLPNERDAYLTSLATLAPAAVLNQYPRADANTDGALDISEAARLVTGGMFQLRIEKAGPQIITCGPLGGAAAACKAICIPAEDCEEDFVFCAPAAGTDCEIIELDCDVQVGGVKIEAGDSDAIEDVIVRKLDGAAIAGGAAIAPLKIRMKQAGLPKVAWTTEPPNSGVAEWLVANVAVVPTPAQLRAAMTAVESLPLADFMEMHPEADTDGDGAVSAAERDAFMAEEMKGVHKKILSQFPEADGNDDGELTEDEMHEYFKSQATGTWVTDGCEIKDRIICIDKSQAGGTTTQQKVRCKVIVKSAGDEEVVEPK